LRERVRVRRFYLSTGNTEVERGVERRVEVAPSTPGHARVQHLKATDGIGSRLRLARTRIHLVRVGEIAGSACNGVQQITHDIVGHDLPRRAVVPETVEPQLGGEVGADPAYIRLQFP